MPPESNYPLIIAIFGIVVVFAVIIAVLWVRNSKVADEVDTAEAERDAARDRIRQAQEDFRLLKEELRKLQEKNTALEAEKIQTLTWLDTSEKHREALEEELKTRPKVERNVYRILTVGMKATGKSSLTLKWANPLMDLGKIEGTKMERYERTVSLVKSREKIAEHVFELYDWGGEHIVEAQAQLVRGEIDGRKGDIHGILMVVDLGGRDAQAVDERRIAEQIDMFNAHALQFFLTTEIVRACKTIVLFINKSDLIPGPPAQAETHAIKYFFPLIQALNQHSKKLDVRVMVGSASFGHSTHILFSHFVKLILPETAYDQQLLAGEREALPRKRTQTITPGINGIGHLAMLETPAAPIQQPRGHGNAPPAPANARVAPNAPPQRPPPARQPTMRLAPSNGSSNGSSNSDEPFDVTMPYKNPNAPVPTNRKN